MTNADMGERQFGLLKEIDISAERYIYMSELPGMDDYAIIYIRPVLVRKNKKRLVQSGRYQVVVDLAALDGLAPAGLTGETIQPFKRLMAGYEKRTEARKILRSLGNDSEKVNEAIRILEDAGLIKDAVKSTEGVLVEEHAFDSLYRIRLIRNSYKECVIECFERGANGAWEADYRKTLTRDVSDASIDKIGRRAVKSLIAKMMIDEPGIRFQRVV